MIISEETKKKLKIHVPKLLNGYGMLVSLYDTMPIHKREALLGSYACVAKSYEEYKERVHEWVCLEDLEDQLELNY